MNQLAKARKIENSEKGLNEVQVGRWGKKAYTQREIAEMLNTEIHRQPRDEVMVFDAIEYVGEIVIQRTYDQRTYPTHVWRGRVYTNCGTPLMVPRSASIDVQLGPLRRALDDCIIEVDPHDWYSWYTFEVDEFGEFLSFKEGVGVSGCGEVADL